MLSVLTTHMGNNTTIVIGTPADKNSSDNKDQNSGVSLLTLYRPKQEWSDVYIQSSTAALLQLFIILLNILMNVVFHQCFLKTIPHLIFQNIMIVDLLAALLPGTVWSVTVALNNIPWQTFLGWLCDLQGFMNSALYFTFLLTIALVSFNQVIAISAPSAYNRLLNRQYIARSCLVGVWVLSSLFAAFPIFSEWGSYGPYDSNCWMAWATGSDVILSFNIFTVVLTIGPAYLLTTVAVVLVLLKPRGKVFNSEIACKQ